MEIKLAKPVTERAVHEMREFLAEEHELELGHLGAELLLEQMIRLVGPAIYNRAVTDVQAWLQDKLSDLDSDVFQAEPPPARPSRPPQT